MKIIFIIGVLGCFSLFLKNTQAAEVNVCEGGYKSINCPQGQLIQINGAFFGRSDKNVCNQQKAGDTLTCKAPNSMTVVKRWCDRRPSCIVYAAIKYFGDPCPRTSKYLNVGYQCVSQDPCISYIPVNNYQRSTGFVSTGDRFLSDRRLAPGWYRFVSKAGGDIPTSCPKPMSCGTRGPVWLQGSNPTQPGEEKLLTACVSVNNKCCASDKRWQVKVKSCVRGQEHFLVYLLQPVPGHDMAYCAGDKKKCPPGQNSKNGFEPGCTSQFPRVNGKPKLTVGVRDRRVELRCEFSSQDTDDTNIFQVTWVRGTPAVPIGTGEMIIGGKRTATIRNTNKFGTAPLFRLGNTFACRVRAWFATSPNRTSPIYESNHFFAGIKVYPSQLKIRLSEKQKPMSLYVTATAPIICAVGNRCSVWVELGQSSTQNMLDLCDLEFKPGQHNKTKELSVVAKRDFINDGNQMMLLKFHVPEHIDPIDWNNHEKIPDIQIIAENVATARCTSSGDPHIRTYDGMAFNHYAVGDYVFTKSTCRKFEVHVRTWKCASVSCNCGVAAREGDDVVIVDMCRDKIPRAWFASSVEPQPGTNLQRSDNGKSFIITFPSGSFVRFDVHRWYANIYFANVIVQASSDDFQCTSGICGTFDNNKGNDMKSKGGRIMTGLHSGNVAPKEFTESWKLPVGQSLFYHREVNKKCNASRVKHYCTCEELCCGQRVVKCDYTGYSSRPMYVSGFKHWKNLNFPGGAHCGKRKRRAVADGIILPDDSGEIGKYIYDPLPLSGTLHSWPTPSGKSEAWTTQYCRQIIMNSDAGVACKTISDFDFQPFINQCVEDIQITDNTTFAESAILTMQGACEELVLKDTALWVKNPSKNNTLEPPAEIGNTLCLNLCSQQGQCVNATCVCNKGFTSPDCSINETQGPTVDSIPASGLCDVRQRDCRKTRVVGSNFIDGDNLVCRVREVEISSKPYIVSGTEKINKGQLLSFREVLCEFDNLPLKISALSSKGKGKPAGGYTIEISNDKKVFSKQSALYVVYDSKCIVCTGESTGICTKKPDSCQINGFCYARNEINLADPCYICDPDRSTTDFVKDKGVYKPKFSISSAYLGFEKQLLKIQLTATETNGRKVRYELGDEYDEAVSLEPSGLFKWTPRQKKSGSFKVKAINNCGLETVSSFVVEVMNCTICKTGQICKVNSSNEMLAANFDGRNIVCGCPDGCTGETCTEDLEGSTCINAHLDKTVADDSKEMVTVVFSSLAAVIVFAVLAIGVLISVKNRHKIKLARGMAKPGPLRTAQVVENVYDDVENDSFNNFSYSLEKLQK